MDNELEFEVEVVFKSRQLQGHEQDCFVKWKDSSHRGLFSKQIQYGSCPLVAIKTSTTYQKERKP